VTTTPDLTPLPGGPDTSYAAALPTALAASEPGPLLLAPNQPPDRPYRGGSGIAKFRGNTDPLPFTPEDFVASTTEVFSGHGVGLTVLPDGRTLRDAVEADPLGYLGAAHVERFGSNTMLLVKLLSTDERLFVHYHPDAAFAESAFSRTMGKTEAWIVVDTDGRDDAYAYLGFNRPVADDEVASWITGQDVPAMLDAMNRVPLHVGDTLFVPAGIGHAIGPGITLVELQEPTDLSILLEYEGFPGFTLDSALLGLDVSTAVSGLQRRQLTPDQLDFLQSGRRGAVDGSGAAATAQQLFPSEGDVFFTAWELAVDGRHALPAGFAVLVVIDGDATLESAAGSLALTRGATALIPFGAGPTTIVGTLRGILCAPPAAPTA
jgi:mannose-6-phosphate isomerase